MGTSSTTGIGAGKHHESTTAHRHGAAGDPRIGWSGTADAHAPALRHRRDGILPTVAAALSVRGETLTCTASEANSRPPSTPWSRTSSTPSPAHSANVSPDAAPKPSCSPATSPADEERGKRASRKPLTNGEARRALKHAKLTTRHIREDGDPLHGGYARPCRACAALLAHFGVPVVDPATDTTD